MKSGTPHDPKINDLMEALDIPRYQAVGLMESLWLLAQEHLPAGDIGAWSNTKIAREIDWRGNPDDLVRALVATRWLDEDDTHRLLIHDWAKHCYYLVHNRLYKEHKRFADGTIPSPSRLSSDERAEHSEWWNAEKRAEARESVSARVKEHNRVLPNPTIPNHTAAEPNRTEPAQESAVAAEDPDPAEAEPTDGGGGESTGGLADLCRRLDIGAVADLERRGVTPDTVIRHLVGAGPKAGKGLIVTQIRAGAPPPKLSAQQIARAANTGLVRAIDGEPINGDKVTFTVGGVCFRGRVIDPAKAILG
jgi:hypothetical protein